MSFADRLALAHTELVLTYERRDNFLSDSDVIEASERWTTDTWDDDEGFVGGDQHQLQEALFEMLTREEA